MNLNDQIPLVLVKTLASIYSRAYNYPTSNSSRSIISQKLKKIDKKLFEFLVSSIKLSKKKKNDENIDLIANSFLEVLKEPTSGSTQNQNSQDFKNDILKKREIKGIFYFKIFVKTILTQLNLLNEEMEIPNQAASTKGAKEGDHNNLRSYLLLETAILKGLNFLAISISNNSGTYLTLFNLYRPLRTV